MNRIALAAAGFAATTLSLSVSAQQESGPKLEEVLVTAQKIAQSVQDVPISMSVVSAEDMERNSVFTFADTAQLTPGVAVNESSAALASINVRGVGPGFFSASTQSVPIFVDEVPVSWPGAAFSTMVDVERVELLRGPQGTLYGRNAPAGAYNITTAAPTSEGVEGNISATYAQWDNNNEPTVDVRGAINLPVTDTVAVRFAGVYAESDGWIDMESPLAEDDATGGKDHRAIRAKLRWDISDNSELNVTANYQDIEDYWSLTLYDGLVPRTGGANPVDAIYTDFEDRADYGEMPSHSKVEVKDLAMKYRWAGDLTNIDMILGYQDFDSNMLQNQDPYPTLTPGSVDFWLSTQMTTFELRASDAGDKFDYVAGVFISDSDTESDTQIDLGSLVSPNMVEAETFSAAVFGNFTFHLAEQWDFTAGARYEQNDQEYRSDAEIAGFGGELDEDLDFDHLSWSLKLKYFLNENTTAYVAVDNAYRQGGVNSYVPAIEQIGELIGSEPIISSAEAMLFFDEEVATAFEIGVKGTALDDSLRYSVAVFYQEYEDHILRQVEPNSPALLPVGSIYTLVNVNAEEVVTQGVEFDMLYLISDSWSIDFRGAYFDPTIEQWDDKLCSPFYGDPVGETFCPVDSGTALNAAPRWNTTTQLRFFAAIGGDWNLDSNLAWIWRDEAELEGDDFGYNDTVNYLNLNVRFSSEALSLALWGKNLTDEQGIQGPWETANGDPTQPAALSASHNKGREYGVTVAYNF